MKCSIYDFETLSQDSIRGAVVSLAVLNFDTNTFSTDEPYRFVDLVNSCHTIKFDVEEQVKKYQRKIDKSTLEWWSKQGEEAKKQLKASDEDVSIECLYEFLTEDVRIQTSERVYTRGNTFDPILLRTVLADVGKEDPTKWWTIRDTRSLFEGMFYGSNMDNKFMIEECKDVFIAHDPRHDIALDVMRFQALARVITGHS